MENEKIDGDESGRASIELSTAQSHITKCQVCNTTICKKFKQLIKMLTHHQLVKFLQQKLRQDQKEFLEAERRRKAGSAHSQIAKTLLSSKRKVHTNFSSDLLSPPPQRIPPASPQNLQDRSAINLELDTFLINYGLNRPAADEFGYTRVDDVTRMLHDINYEASLSIQDRLSNFRFAFLNSESFHGIDRGEIENEITRLIGEYSRANPIPTVQNNENREPALVQQQQQPPMPQRAKRRTSKILPHRKSSQRKQNGCWPAKVGLTKQKKKAQLYIYCSNRLYGYVFQKKLNKAKCWRCQSTWNYSTKEKRFTEDPERGHRHQECQRLISDIELDQLQRVFLARISDQGLTNENADVNYYLQLFKRLLDAKFGNGSAIFYSNYKNFKVSIEKALFDQKDYNEEIEQIDRDFIIPKVFYIISCVFCNFLSKFINNCFKKTTVYF